MTLSTPIVRILVIDDNPADRRLVIRQLEQQFSQLQVREILEATTLAEALEDNSFDAVVTDYQLRWTTGLEVLQAVKQRYPYCPVIMFTNTGNEELAVEAMKTGLDDYVLKQPSRYGRVPLAVQSALERSQAKRRAELLEIRLRGMLEQLSVGVFRSNAAGQLLECNPAFLTILRVRSLEEAQALGAIDFTALFTQLYRLPAGEKLHQEMPIQQQNQPTIWVLLSLTQTIVEAEQVVDGLIEDITLRKQVETELQQLNETLEERVRERTAQLEASVQELEEFFYFVSHDLREPLRSIREFSRILLEQRAANAQEEDLYLQRIYLGSQRAEQMVMDLLTYSQLNQEELSLQPLNLSRLIREILEQLEPEIQSRRAQIHVEEPLLNVIGSRRILLQVITNLLTNALKFVAPATAPQIRLWTEARSVTKVRLWVEDNGIGIAQQYQERIFNVFVRLHSNEVYSGTGIGLAIVRRGVQRMGGTVGVESQPGQASRFWVELPSEESR